MKKKESEYTISIAGSNYSSYLCHSQEGCGQEAQQAHISTVVGTAQLKTHFMILHQYQHAAAAKSLSRVRLLAIPWAAAHQAPPSMGFSRQEYQSGLPLPSLFISPKVAQIYSVNTTVLKHC